MSKSRFGIVLAAGVGSRLKPLTNETPKPLLPFFDSCPLELSLDKLLLETTGISEIGVNTHHLSHQISDYFSSHNTFCNQKIHISNEPTLLGTAGVYSGFRPWLNQADSVCVINGDIITDFPFHSLIKTHDSSNAFATMALLPYPHNDGGLSIWCDQNSRVKLISRTNTTNETLTPHGFACMQILSREFLNTIPPDKKPSDLIKYYNQGLQQNKIIVGVVMSPNHFWADIGTPENYLRTHLRFLETNNRNNNHVNYVVTQSKTIVYKNTIIGKNTKISESVLLPGAVIPPETILHNAIAGKNFCLNNLLTIHTKHNENIHDNNNGLSSRVNTNPAS